LARRLRQARQREAPILLLLALGAGSFDALCYLGLHDVFPANMTGNTVLLAVAVARGSGWEAARSAAALGGFAVGVACATLLMPRHFRRWPRGAARVLALEATILLAMLVWWLAVGVPAVRYWLIVLAGGAMGVQSAAVYNSHVNGVTTTYMTGTYMKAIVRAVYHLRRIPHTAHPHNLPGAAWVVYVAGALIGALVEHAWHGWAVLIPLCLVGPTAIGAMVTRGEERELDGDHHDRPSPAGRR
jgi:uncharacterized membrane protein YoaK (UPF0700 family)